MPKNCKSNNTRLNMKKYSSSDDSGLCVVCYRKAVILSIGECDHPVCYECSTRMRVLCARTECPICRKDMAMVVFTCTVEPFKNIEYLNLKCERRYSIYFENDNIMKAYDILLQHKCSECPDSEKFQNFNLLKDHMRKFHEKFYCDLCVENLKIFTEERRSYTRSRLAQHRRVGDTDDKSHRGHPLCEFCDTRYMDSDELFRHLRRDHFFCHFCDADGTHFYYDDYDALREHFRTGHFLCEEGNCIDERFTSVFRTKLDLQVHTTQNHGHLMSKTEARQARTVDIAFTVNHRQGQHFTERGRGGRRGPEMRGRRQPQDLEEQAAAAAAIPPSEIEGDRRSIDINCVQDFPSLNGPGPGGVATEGEGTNSNSNSIANKLAQQNRFTIRTTRGGALNEEEFPSLGSTTSVNLSNASSNTKTNTTNPSTSLHFSVNTKKNNQFANSQMKSGPNVSIQYNCSKPSHTPSYSDANAFSASGKIKPRIGNVSHSGNITVKSTPTGTRPKSALMEDDFPMLHPCSKPLEASIASWVTNNSSSSSAASKGPKKVSSSESNSKKSSNNINNNNNSGISENLPIKYQFESGDFPSLTPSSGNQQQKLNYSGRSTLTIPMKKPHQIKDTKENDVENEENLGNKGKKKKKAPLGKGTFIENDKNTQNSLGAKPTKKKPLTLNNAFENIDPDGPMEDYSMRREGDYETVAPVMSSNIKFITSTNSCSNDTLKSELQIGTLKVPDFGSEDFPSLGLGFSSKGTKKTSKSSQSTREVSNNSKPNWHVGSQASKKHSPIPPGFSNKNNVDVPPGFANANMTFTSSSGHKFSISSSSEVPSKEMTVSSKNSKERKKNSKSQEFILPPNFEQRNNALINAIHSGCEGNNDKFNKFKQLSGMFRGGQIKGQQYYERCKQIMGKSMFHNILPELLALLPDIEKQQGVFEAYRKVDGGQGCEACFAVCAVCQQVLIADDFSDHMTKHEFSPSNYPSLGNSTMGHQTRK